jgi:octanoyl-[GcvH]:protein N-octanoyltransferase
MAAFGGPVSLFGGDAEDLVSSASAESDIDRVRDLLAHLNDGGAGNLRIYRPHPTAAFAPRDTTLPGYAEAVAAMRRLGFTPVERRAGGQLAVYDSQALVIDLVAPHPEPRQHVKLRFEGFSAAIAAALKRFGLDARVGQVAGEYCPGDYSVNAGGRVKLAGLAQRVGRTGYHLGAVISVEPSPAARDAVAAAYAALGFPFAPSSFGDVRSLAQGANYASLRIALAETLAGLIGVTGLQPR